MGTVNMAPQDPNMLTTNPIVGKGKKAGRPNKRLMIIVGVAAIVAVAIIGFAVWWFFMRGTNEFDQAAARIDVTNAGFMPATVKIKKDQAVTWLNKDVDGHQVFADQTVTADLDSVDVLLTGDTYTYTFEKTGTYHFYDPGNPSKFQGTVIVE